MKACKKLLLLILLLSCQAAFTQTINSSLTIRINRGSYLVSGIVSDDFVKNEVAQKIRTQLGANGDFSKLLVQRGVKSFQPDWRAELDKSLLKIKGWKSGVFIFSNNRKLTDKDYPPLPVEIANAQILLTNGQKINVRDYKNKVVVLFLFASWVSPGLRQADELNRFYKTISSRNVEIIGIDVDDDPDEIKNFPKLIDKHNLQFKLGWMDFKLFPLFVKISKLDGIPQVFVTYNGRLRAIFTGAGPLTTNQLKETILNILDENNL